MTTTVIYRPGPGADPARLIECPETDPWAALARCLTERLASDAMDAMAWAEVAGRYHDADKADRLVPGGIAGLAQWCHDWLDGHDVIEWLAGDEADWVAYARARVAHQLAEWSHYRVRNDRGAVAVAVHLREHGPSYSITVPAHQWTPPALPAALS